jgi:hypothetical protein
MEDAAVEVPDAGLSATAPERSPSVPYDDPLAGRAGFTQGMIPGRERRRSRVERVSMRVLATGGIIGIAVVLGAVLGANDVAGWIVGLVVGLTSVILAAILWSSRQL